MDNPNKLVERLIADMQEDIITLHKVKMGVSSKTATLLQHIIDSYHREAIQIYKRSNLPVPEWCDNEFA